MSSENLVQLSDSVWVIPGPTNIGMIDTGEGIYLVDSGNDKEAGRKINKLLAEMKRNLIGIINTHSNADHIGGNDYLQRLHSCRIYSSQTEKAFIESPEIEAAFLWGGYPLKEMDNKFFRAKPSKVTDSISGQTVIHENISLIPLPGHFFEMYGVCTKDKICFLGDCLFGVQTLDKYKIPFIYDVALFKKTIEAIKGMEMDWYVMSHGSIETDIADIADKNLAVVAETENRLCELLADGDSFDAILAKLCDSFGIQLDIGQYALVGSTVRSFLSYLRNTERICCEFLQNRLIWRTV